MSWLLDILRDPLMLLWALPAIGTMSIVQMWKISERNRTGKKPRNALSALVASCVGMVLYALVHGLWSEEVLKSLAIGLAAGPAVPMIWLLVTRCGPDGLSCAMRGERRRYPRIDDEANELRRRRAIHDTLYGDDDPTLRDQIRKWREERRRERDG